MKMLLKPALAAGIALAAFTAPVMVASASAEVVKGIGIVNADAVLVNSTAYQTAQTQRATTYKAQYDAAEARRNQAQQQIQPLVQQYQTAAQQPNANQQSLQQQAAQIQQLQQQAQQDIQRILAPVSLSEAYVAEQLGDQIKPAIEAAAKRQNITLIFSPDTVIYADNAYNLNQSVLDELNRLLPSAQLTPPQGWLPRQLREQQAAQQAAQQGATAATPAPAQQPTGR